MDGRREFRRLIAAVRDEIQESRLPGRRSAGEINPGARFHRPIQPAESIPIDLLQFLVLAGDRVDPCGASGGNGARRAVLHGDDQIGQPFERAELVLRERLRSVGSAAALHLRGEMMHFLRGDAIERARSGQGEREPAQHVAA